MSVIEVTTFRLRPGTDEARFLEADSRVQTGFFYGNEGLLRRTTARADGGGWAVVTSWASHGAAEAAASKAAGDTLVGRFMSFVDPTTLHTDCYQALEA